MTRHRAGLPSRRHFRYAKVQPKAYKPGGGLRVKVRKKLRNWWSAGASLEVLRWIREGVRLEWSEGKPPARFHQGRSFAAASPEEQAFVREETQRLLASGAVRVARPGEATHVSKAFLVPKSNGKFRMIWDGRRINESVRERKLTFETLRSLKHLARKGDWMLQVDLTDGFHILGIHEKDVPKMAWQCAVTGETYLYQVLPFGYQLSPFAFCTAMSVFTRVLRSPDVASTDRGQPEALLRAIKHDLLSRGRSAHVRRLRILPYMDDYLALFPSREEAQRGAIQMQTTLAWLGLEANPKKCVWEPTQQLVHLGLIVDTRRGLFLVPQEKEKKLASFARGIIQTAKRDRRLFSRRQLSVFTGLAQSIVLAVPVAPLYLRELHDCSATGRDWSCRVRLTRQALRDLQWWADLSRHNLGRAIWRSPAQHQLHSDASTFAWGGVLDGHLIAHGLWTAEEKKHHITLLELIAVHRNLAAMSHRLRGRTIHLHEDNQAVVYILRRKTTRSPVIMSHLRKLWALTEGLDCTLRTVSYVRSADNPADAPSRLYGNDSWPLRRSEFERLDRYFRVGTRCVRHTVDRFANSANALIPRFNALHVDPRAEALNCFSQDWSEEINWCHPPVDQLDNLAQFLRERPARCTVIAPHWPGKAWFRELLDLAHRAEVIGRACDLADPVYLQKFALRPPGRWSLVAFRLG